MFNLGAVAASTTCFGEETAKIDPPDVFVRVAIVRDGLESIRFVMGRPNNTQSEIPVKKAAPREVFFQALTLFRKADRLCFEHTREREDEPQKPKSVPTPGDVYAVVDAALGRIEKVKAKLEIQTSAVPSKRDQSKTPTDVFRSIVQANRQLNLLLEKRFTPSDVFQEVTRGVAYTSRLLEGFSDATPIPERPEFEAGKRPADVYLRLVDCFNRTRKIAEISGEQILEFEPDKKQIERAEPSDVYDIASMLISELAHLHSRVEAKPPQKVYYPGRKFPSHVYQRAGILQEQLVELESHTRKNPNWLNPSSTSP